MAERVDDVAEPPAVLVSDQQRFLRSGADGLLDDPVGVVDDEQFELGKTISYRGRPHVVIGVTPIGARPCIVELEDAESGRLRRVRCDDPNLLIDGAKPLPPDESRQPEA